MAISLSELAAFNAQLPQVKLKDPTEEMQRFQQMAGGLQTLQKNRYDFQQQQQNDALDIVTATYQNPIWDHGTPEQAMGLINQTREQLLSRGIPITKGGILDQMEGQIAQGLLNQDPQSIAAARNILRDAVNQFGGERASRIQPQLGTSGRNPASVTQGGIGSGGRVQIAPVSEEVPGPNAPAAPTPASQAAPPAQPAKPSRTMQSYFKYPVRGTEPFIFLPGEEQAQQTGIARREALEKGVLNLPNQRNELELARKQVAEIKDAKFNPGGVQWPETGFLGATKRNLYKFFGVDDYVALEKSLERVAVESAQALGANTNDARESVRTAMGGNARSLDVIEKVIDQELGKLKHVEMKARARQLFGGGDRNYEAFERVWQDNADPKIFEAMHKMDLIEDKDQQQKMFESLFGKPGTKTFKEAARKYQNIQSLVGTGSL